MITTAIFIQYLLLPIIAFALTGLMFWLKKKNGFIQNKQLIIYILVATLVLAVPGVIGFLGNAFSPWGYLLAQLIYLALGRWHVDLAHRYFTEHRANNAADNEVAQKERIYATLFEILLTILIMVTGGYLFTIVFNLFSPYKDYNMVAVTCLFCFMIPLLFLYTYQRFIEIPFAIYKVWEFKPGQSAQEIAIEDIGRLRVISLELTKTVHDGRRITLKVKAPQNLLLGHWMARVLDDHKEKNQLDRIDTFFGASDSYGWIFYIKPSFFLPRRYLDYDKTIAENNIRERHVIVCKRVIDGEIEKVVTVKSNNE